MPALSAPPPPSASPAAAVPTCLPMRTIFKLPFLGPLLQKMCPFERNRARIEKIMRCPDNQLIPRVPSAGNMEGHSLTAHNGLKLDIGSLDTWCNAAVLKANRGVCEPQHERAFFEIVSAMGNSPLILDVGARKGYYALWLKKARPGARCVVIEPQERDLKKAQKNFTLNGLQAQFFRAYVGMTNGRQVEDTEVVTVEEIARRLKTDYINILHADIEGYELELLKGAAPLMKDRGIDYIMVDTHSDDLHAQCKELFAQYKYIIIAELTKEQSVGDDGLLVARRAELKGVEKIALSAAV